MAASLVLSDSLGILIKRQHKKATYLWKNGISKGTPVLPTSNSCLCVFIPTKKQHPCMYTLCDCMLFHAQKHCFSNVSSYRHLYMYPCDGRGGRTSSFIMSCERSSMVSLASHLHSLPCMQVLQSENQCLHAHIHMYIHTNIYTNFFLIRKVLIRRVLLWYTVQIICLIWAQFLTVFHILKC